MAKLSNCGQCCVSKAFLSKINDKFYPNLTKLFLTKYGMGAIRKCGIINLVTLEECDPRYLCCGVWSVEWWRRWEQCYWRCPVGDWAVRAATAWADTRDIMTTWQHGITDQTQQTSTSTFGFGTIFQCFSWSFCCIKSTFKLVKTEDPPEARTVKNARTRCHSNLNVMQLQFTLEIFMEINGLHLHFLT